MELMELMEDWKGYVNAGDISRPDGYEQKLKEVNDLLHNNNNLPPHKHEYLLREAITTSDFPYLFGDVLDRQVLAAYKAVDPVWKPFVKMSTVPRISPQVGGYRFAITGGDDHLDMVHEKGEYLASGRDEARYSLSVDKYGRQFDISWEAMINDDLGALRDTPQRFAMAAVRTEHRVVTSGYARNTGIYQAAARGNAANIALTIANLETGISTMQSYTDAAGEIIMNRPKFLVVPPCLEFTARQILTSATKMWVESAGGAATAYPTTNVVANYGLTLIVDPYLSIYGGADLATQWYLFADPRDIAVLEAAHLKGHERPEICMKASDKVTIGGGQISPLSGDFDTDNVFYRVRLVFGVTSLDWRGTFMGGSTVA